ncbi:MAG TPA: DinB family protein [Egibacteraceae bacterium]|nr:DinB family protein [Egibacteraceae bacterium]
MTREPATPEDLRRAAAAVVAALWPHRDGDWQVRAGELDWTCLDTLGHTVDALRFYAANLATRTRVRRAYPWAEAFGGTPEVWLLALEATAELLAVVAETTADDDRAFHPAGLADAEGFLAMGCDEVLVHGADVAQGLGVALEAPDDVAALVLARLFPWVEPGDGERAWDLLRWANGRTELPGRARLGPDWWWHCAPLDEWDGSGPRRRSEPPPR